VLRASTVANLAMLTARLMCNGACKMLEDLSESIQSNKAKDAKQSFGKKLTSLSQFRSNLGLIYEI
jgi:hypothetical protein